MKRTLALVLALVMAIGLMAFPVSADFTDDADIKYTEAVDVMSAIGVIDGFEDGSFDPDGYLTREQAAKVVAYLMLGADDADALSASSAPFDDVAANRWSAGYIAYCVNEGIINGRSDTTFDPTGNVTGYEFAKLMLGCLGYDGSIEKYTGASWNINVAKTALTIGLFNGNRGANYNVPLTREEAALYAFNMLQADLVDYDSRGTNIEVGDGVVINTGASKAEPITSANEYSTIDDELANKDKEDNNLYVIQFAEMYFEDLEKHAGSPDAFGRPSTKWEYDNDDVGTYSDTADVTYTVATKGRDIYDDINADKDTDYTYYVDGKLIDDITDIYEDFDIASGSTGDKKIGGNGALVEVYEDPDADNTYIVTVVNTYVGQITDWIEADEDDDVKESVIVTPVNSDVAPVLADNGTFETTKYDEDDADDETVVLYTAAWDEDEDAYVIKSVDTAESVTAEVTRTTGDTSFVAGGETYKYSAKNAGTIKYDENADDAVIYLDSYGYAIYVDFDGSDSEDYAYVLDIAEDDGDIWDTEGTMYAKIVLATGEMVVVEIDNEGSEDQLEQNFETHIVTYDVDRHDVYTLKDANSAGQTGDVDITISKGSSRITVTNEEATNKYYANSKTVFIVADYDDDDATKYDNWDFTVYTGIANVPSIEGAGRYRAHLDGNNADFVFIEAPNNAASSEDYVYVVYDKNADVISSADGDYIEADAIINGKITTLNIEYNSDAYKELTKDLVVESVTYDSDDFVTDFGKEVKDMASGESERIKDGVVKVDDEYYSVGDDCDVFVNDDGDLSTGSTSSVRNGDSVIVIFDEDEIATTIIVIRA